MIEASIIIPTYNRSDVLKKTLDSLNNQTYDSSYEVIVVDDGSSSDLESMLQASNYKYKLVFCKQQHRGPAAARNLGIKMSSGRFIIIMGDDTIPNRHFIQEHVKTLEQNDDIACAGYVTWHPQSNNESIEKVLEICGVGGASHATINEDDCGFRFFCTASISLARKWLEKDLFDEDFPYAAFEDTELGYRLCRKGLRIVLNRKALSEHLHHYEIEDLCRRQELIGRAASILIRKHPELKKDIFCRKRSGLIRNICLVIVKTKLMKLINKNYYWLSLATYCKYDGIRKEGRL